jgi:hypothetical protein
MFEPFHLFQNTPFDPVVPTEARFVGMYMQRTSLTFWKKTWFCQVLFGYAQTREGFLVKTFLGQVVIFVKAILFLVISGIMPLFSVYLLFVSQFVDLLVIWKIM